MNQTMDQAITPLYAETRILLNLWSLGGEDIARYKFVPRAIDDVYLSALDSLEDQGAIAPHQKTKRTTVYSLTAAGQQRLAKALANKEFKFPVQVGAKTINALLQWFQETGSISEIMKAPEKADEIRAYDEFQSVALSTYDQLNRDYNMSDLVPIYRLRRQIGDRVSRTNFNEWMLQLQANDFFILMEGSVEDSAPDKIEDSITTRMGKLRCYAKRLSV